jgi:Protein of unknown function (DUF2911)/Tetratricopeptide repeat
MKKITFLTACLFAICCLVEGQQLRTPAPSSTQNVKQEFGLSTIELSYSRPGVKGRKIFGELVPFGKVWRTGANLATTITFGDEVMIGDKKVPAGKYGLLTIPDKDQWTIIISKQVDVTSPADYKQDQDVVRVSSKTESLPFSVESFTIMFNDVKPNSINIDLIWDQTLVTLPVNTDIDTKIMAQIKNQVEGDTRPYYQAAMYYMDNGKDLNKALTWFNKSIEQNPKAYWAYHQRANLLAKMGKKQDAIASANKSIELAKEAKNDDYVTLNEKLLATLK